MGLPKDSLTDELCSNLKKLCCSMDMGKGEKLYPMVLQLINLMPDGILGNTQTHEKDVGDRICSMVSKRFHKQSDAVSLLHNAMDALAAVDMNSKLPPIVLEFMMHLTSLAELSENVLPTSGNAFQLPASSNRSVSSFIAKLTLKHTLAEGSMLLESGAPLREDDLENELMQDGIYAVTGMSGKYLLWDTNTGKMNVNWQRGKEANLEACDAELLLRMADVGSVFNQVKQYTDPENKHYPKGRMGQGIVTVLTKEITDYYGLAAKLQDDVNAVRKMTLLCMTVRMMEPMERLQWLIVIAGCSKEHLGGALASAIYEYVSHGDPMVQEIAKNMLRSVCVPLHCMLDRWMIDGMIEDQNDEFFIEELPNVDDEQLWHVKYHLRDAMKPSFISGKLANEILVVGKNINLLREVCKMEVKVNKHSELKRCLKENPSYLYSTVPNTQLHKLITEMFLSTSMRVLDILRGSHRLLDHLEAMRNYLLLGQGNFANVLMANLMATLDRPANEMKQHVLWATVAEAVRNSGTSEGDEPEVLNYLEVNLFGTGSNGWDVFSLNYRVPEALSVIFGPTRNSYRILFKQLWYVKQYESIITDVWRNQMLLAKSKRALTVHIRPVLQQLQICSMQVFNFIHQMQRYLLVEVVECSWALFRPRIAHARTVDEVLEAHGQYLERIRAGIFLNEASHHLGEVFRSSRKLAAWVTRFDLLCQQQLQQTAQEATVASTPCEFIEAVSQYHEQLKQIQHEYDESVCEFLYQLVKSSSEPVRQLAMLLDYNEHYKRRDERLSIPLTFHHIRMTVEGNNTFGESHHTKVRLNED